MEQVTVDLISNFGFPVACVVALASFAIFIIKFILNELVENRKALSMAVETITKFNIKFDSLEEKMDRIEEKLDK